MLWLLLTLLAIPGPAPLPADSAVRIIHLPRGTEHFRLGWKSGQLDSALTARGIQIVTTGRDYIATAGETPNVEYVMYSFVSRNQSPAFLWKVTLAYRAPYGRDAFDSLRTELETYLGPPADRHLPDVETGDTDERITWVDARTAVQLGARWDEPPPGQVDRMLVTWTDRRLRKVMELQKYGSGQKKKKP